MAWGRSHLPRDITGKSLLSVTQVCLLPEEGLRGGQRSPRDLVAFADCGAGPVSECNLRGVRFAWIHCLKHVKVARYLMTF